MATIFHITTRSELEAAERRGSYRAASLDDEGFIHCSYREMLPEVAERFFRGAGDLVLLEIDPTRLDCAVVSEAVAEMPARFPHVFGEIPVSAIAAVHPFSSEDAERFASRPDAALLDRLLEDYDWYDHPEGPKFVETHRDAHRTCGHWLFLPGVISAFHQVLNGDELWLIHRGSLLVHGIDAAGEWTTVRLGFRSELGERPVQVVPAGVWQAAELPPDAPFAFGSNVCAPPFRFEEFRMAERSELLARFPRHADRIRRLTYAG